MATIAQATTFFGMLRGMYTAVGTITSAVNSTASAVNNLATWADESTGTFVDEARAERQIKLVEMRARHAKALADAKIKASQLSIEDATIKAEEAVA